MNRCKGEILLLADAMLGKLAVWLRLFGFDTRRADNKWDDSYVMEVAEKEDRHLLTKDYELFLRYKKVCSKLHKKRLVSCYLKTLDIKEQLVAIFDCFGIKTENLNWIDVLNLPFKPRCSKCNSEIHSIEKEKILDSIPVGTTDHFNHFWICSNHECGKIYWRGKHWDDISKLLNDVHKLLNISNEKSLYEC